MSFPRGFAKKGENNENQETFSSRMLRHLYFYL